MKTSIENMMEQQFNTKKLTPEEEETAIAIQKETMDWFSGLFAWEQIQDLYVDIYVKVFTEDELKEIIQFYRSPLGQKLLNKMPELLQESIEKMQILVQDKMPEFQERLQKTITELEEKYKEE